MSARAAIVAAMLAALPAAAGAEPPPTPTASAPAAAVAHGRLLARTPRYLLFTSGGALALGSGTVVPTAATLGTTLRVWLERATHEVRTVEVEPGAALPGEVDVRELPRDFFVNAASLPSPPAAGKTASGAFAATVTLDVRVPAATPPDDDLYVSTDRSNFGPAEVRMTRVDARRFSVKLQLPAGTQLRYQYTRGSYATVERTRIGGIVTPRALTATDGTTVSDTVARWADTT